MANVEVFYSENGVLSKSELHHLVNVKRYKIADTFELVNGQGLRTACKITSVEPFEYRTTLSTQEEPLKPRITLIQALIKNHFERIVEAAIELGVDEIVPWQAHRSIAKLDQKKYKSLENVVLSASKQSRRSYFPKVSPLINSKGLKQYLNVTSESKVVLLYENAQNRLFESLPALRKNQSLTLIIGPEGGISEQEYEFLKNSGVESYRLTSTILKSTTAAIASLALFRA